MRSKRTTSCYKDLKIASDSESYWENTLHLPPAYESIAFNFASVFSKTEEKMMSMYKGNEEGSVWVYFYKHISHKFLPLFQLPSKYCGVQLYLCKPEGLFNLSNLIRGIVPEWDNQIWSLQCKQHLLSSRTRQGHLCTKFCFLQQWCAPGTRLQERSWGTDPALGRHCAIYWDHTSNWDTFSPLTIPGL